ncbi:toluene tolerance family protein [Candidatus Scalindua japonica]|uniref:Toluene tolerance family protein n=2 Tax=Candidatus Scalindua japonica TaxID=1284222 RepID=A0A286TXA3_9BACT|nr:toluene tolerance family protein [Candidatus Scalindua japonica]
MLLFLLLSKVVVAEVETDAEKTLKSSVDKVFAIMLDKEMTMDQKKTKVIKITNTVFSFPLMAKLSIGKAHWSAFNDKQKGEFINLFTELFQGFYVDKLDLFSDEEVVFEPATMVKKKKIQIPTTLLSKGKKYSMLYKMSNTKEGWKVYDITIEGVSLVHTYRSQYTHILNSGDVEDLLAKMREKNKKKKIKSCNSNPRL